MATYAIGDVQGCFDSLEKLIAKTGFQKKTDELWFAGDLINRGPASLATLRFIKDLGDKAKVVLGNHDLHLLAAYYGAKKLSAKDTAQEILTAPDCDELIDWLRRQALIHFCKTRNIAMVHAGIPPLWSLEKAIELASEVESVLRSDSPEKFFKHMYGNEPNIWDDSLTKHDRRRTITNYFTRMRFCTVKGKLEFESKGGPEVPPKGFLPWFQHPHQLKKTRVIFGHWAALAGETHSDQFIGLDTGCVWGGCLTAWHIEKDVYIQQNCYSERINTLFP